MLGKLKQKGRLGLGSAFAGAQATLTTHIDSCDTPVPQRKVARPAGSMVESIWASALHMRHTPEASHDSSAPGSNGGQLT